MIVFKSAGCGACNVMADAWASAARELRGIVNFGIVDCMKYNRHLCGAEKIMKFPTSEYLSFEHKFSKVLLYHSHEAFEDLTEEVVNTLFNERVKPQEAENSQSNPRIVERNERLLFPVTLKSAL